MKNWIAPLATTVFISACGQLNETDPHSADSLAVQKKRYRYMMCGYMSRPAGGTGGSNDVKIQTGSGTYVLMSNDEHLNSVIHFISFATGCAYGDELNQGYEGQILMVKKLQLQDMSS